MIILGMFPVLYRTHPLTNEICRHPENLESMLAMYEVTETLSTILPFPIQRDIEMLKRRPVSDKVKISQVEYGPEQLIYGNKTCPETLLDTDSASLEERSTCPYYYIISHDPLRYPVVIAEARCKCMYCLDNSTGDNLCEPIFFPKTVLRRQNKCVDGIYEYKPEAYHLQNGCVCAKRRPLSSARQTLYEDQRSDNEEESHKNTGADVPDNERPNIVTSTEGSKAKFPFTFA